jgi:hypothetical protein
MARDKQASKGKRRRKVLPFLGAAGTLAVTGSASATAPTANMAPPDPTPLPVLSSYDEELSDVSLATFYVFDREIAPESLLDQRVAGRCGGCRGCAAAGRCGGARCAVARCAAARCAVARCAVARCGAGCAVARCAIVRRCACAGCGCTCSGCSAPCWSWTGAGWIYVC